MSDRVENEDPHVFVEVDEGDPFNTIQLLVTEDTVGFIVGELKAEPGRYELRRVDDCDESDNSQYQCPVCHSVYPERDDAEDHVATHPGVKPDAVVVL